MKDLSLDEVKELLSGPIGKSDLIAIVTQRFGMGTGYARYQSKCSLLSLIETAIRNEETHNAIARACGKKVGKGC